ncbi:hypothetical protein, partial [Plasmodium yoelii yoelii]
LYRMIKHTGWYMYLIIVQIIQN